MNTTKLRSKRVIIPSVAALAALGVGAGLWSATAADDVRGSERDRVGAAAVRAAGGGTAVEVETSDDRGEAYEVEVRKDDGTEVDVALDRDLEIVGREDDGQEDDSRDDDSRDDSGDDSRDDSGDDDRILGAAERTRAERAALAAVGGGTVEDVEASDDPGEAYEVEVRGSDLTEWEVSLDSDFRVLSKTVSD